VTFSDWSRRKWFKPALTAGLVITGVLGGFTVGGGPRCHSGCPTTADAAALHAPAQLTFRPGSRARGVDPLEPVSVTATSGRLTDVKMVSDSGKSVAGVL